jgi:hypothetical protein
MGGDILLAPYMPLPHGQLCPYGYKREVGMGNEFSITQDTYEMLIRRK